MKVMYTKEVRVWARDCECFPRGLWFAGMMVRWREREGRLGVDIRVGISWSATC